MQPNFISHPLLQKQMILSVILGAALTLAFAPFFWWFTAPISLSGLVWLIYRSTSKKEAFLMGWCFGFGHYATSLYWITIALFTDIGSFWWLVPFSLIGIAAAMALYSALYGLLLYIIPLRGIFFLGNAATLWLIIEAFRATLFTGFPWNLLGYITAAHDTTMQTASIWGIYGLSLITFLIATAPCIYLVTQKKLYHLSYLSFILIGSSTLWYYGYDRLAHSAALEQTHEKPVYIRIVQANIKQSAKWEPASRFQNFKKHIYMSMRPSPHPLDVIIWPESATPYPLHDKSELLPLIGEAIPPQGVLLTGSLRAHEYEKGQYHIWNSIHALSKEKNIIGYYDKVHLVPFGEYIPLRTLIPNAIEKITYGMHDFSSGKSGKALSFFPSHIPPVWPLVCYEVIFPERAFLQNSTAKWLLNTTNDGWFGKSIGPHHHFHMARFRAIEQGVPLVRSANTGISGVIDAFGRIKAVLPLDKQEVLDIKLPNPLQNKTLFQNNRYIIMTIVLCWCFIVISSLLCQYRNKNKDLRL